MASRPSLTDRCLLLTEHRHPSPLFPSSNRSCKDVKSRKSKEESGVTGKDWLRNRSRFTVDQRQERKTAFEEERLQPSAASLQLFLLI